MSLRAAATRVFSNASGSYSSNVNLAVENSSWSDEQQLQEMYLKRKSFAFNSDRCCCPALAAASFVIPAAFGGTRADPCQILALRQARRGRRGEQGGV